VAIVLSIARKPVDKVRCKSLPSALSK